MIKIPNIIFRHNQTVNHSQLQSPLHLNPPSLPQRIQLLQFFRPLSQMVRLWRPLITRGFVRHTELYQRLVDPFAVFCSLAQFDDVVDLFGDVLKSLLFGEVGGHCVRSDLRVEGTHEILVVEP